MFQTLIATEELGLPVKLNPLSCQLFHGQKKTLIIVTIAHCCGEAQPTR
jgi:hypothetical protein